MKELYLRVWDPVTREMIDLPPGRLIINFVAPRKPPSVTISQDKLPVWVSTRTMDIIEWTTRVDRNGRKIYEGDIISTKYGLSVVLWSYSGCCWKTRYAEAPLLSMIPTDGMEYVGNVRQNAELLE